MGIPRGIVGWARSKWTIAAIIAFVAVAWGAACFATMARWEDATERVEALNGSTVGAYSFVVGPAMISFGPINEVSFQGPKADDASLDVLDAFPEMTCLTLTNTRVTDGGLTHLTRFHNLQYVNYGNVNITFLGPAGESLNTQPLGGGKGLAALKALPSLNCVILTGSGTSDDDIEALSQLKQLTQLDLAGTRVTAEGVARLKGALPGCVVGVR